MVRESAIHGRIKRWLKENGWLVWKNHGSAYSEAGLPDLMAVRDGVFLALEVKGPSGRATKVQERWLREIQDAGGVTAVVRCVDDVRKVIEKSPPREEKSL